MSNLAPVDLNDKYEKPEGPIYLTGTQALVRLPMLQAERDKARGLNTRGFISGYRGSPLGNYDAALVKAEKLLTEHGVRFQPGMNEDLAATAICGTQQVNLYEGATVDGVFSIWYGKGPGVDRSCDAIKHGNMAGTAPHGGVLLVIGDDHGAKSSTIAHQSDQSCIACMVPILNPATVAEYLEYGLVGFELSRYSGCWVALKAVSDIVDSSCSMDLDRSRFEFRLPETPVPPGQLHIRLEEGKLEQERRHIERRLAAVRDFAWANQLDRVVISAQDAHLGIVTSGKSHLDFLRALELLGLTQDELAAIGVSVLKIALTWPLEPKAVAAFSNGIRDILVVEEKRPVIEEQIKAQLFNTPAAGSTIVGKRDEVDGFLLPDYGELTPLMVARALVKRLQRFTDVRMLKNRLQRFEALDQKSRDRAPALARPPFFCAGCPHNSSTKLPQGSRGMAGIGCHAMARWMDHLNTKTVTQMGGEGVNWIGHAPFTKERHVFQNLGDGTYYHSGLMAIRASVGARSNITYKILYNDAVAMTGGQAVEGGFTPQDISNQLWAEGVRRIVVVTDEPARYGRPLPEAPSPHNQWAPDVEIYPRQQLIRVERELRDIEGVTALIYDQTCAAEKRRRRKRGELADPDRRVFINESVCEACGDCSVQSNCVAVQPVETEFGRKRQIDQSTCNKDFSCINGFCPSFVTVKGGKLRMPLAGGTFPEDLPLPCVPPVDTPYSIYVTGIGGTGVVTIGAILGMAAHLEGHGVTVLDVTGLAQKNGAVSSHIRIARHRAQLNLPRIGVGGADLVIGCDLVTAVDRDSLTLYDRDRTHAVVNSDVTPTSRMITDRDALFDADPMLVRLADVVDRKRIVAETATAISTRLFGDSIASNMFLVGYCWQRELIPLQREAIFRAMELNGTAVAMNRAAFEWGRAAANDPSAMERLSGAKPTGNSDPTPSLDALIARRVEHLAAYQDQTYANIYQSLVARVRAAETLVAPHTTTLTEAVARNAFRLMAYKDEYEVARLYCDGSFEDQLQAQFEGDFKLTYHLAPPIFSRVDRETGRTRKRSFGPWMRKVFVLLSRMKGLRGTVFDIFGYAAERRMERRLRDQYRELTQAMVDDLTPDNHPVAVAIASVPDQIRGFGPVKHRAILDAEKKQAKLLQDFYATKTGRQLQVEPAVPAAGH